MPYLDNLATSPKYSNFLQINSLCRSLTGVECPMLTITENIHYNINYFEMLELNLKKDLRERSGFKT